MTESLADDVAAFLQKPAHRNIQVDMEERVSPEIDRRDHPGRHHVALRPAAGPLSVHPLQFMAAGARILQPSCGACANCGPGSSTSEGQVTVSAINRNFPGRSGPGQAWLASPATVMASALAGELTSWAE